jgi:hypothetical protein
VSAVYRVHCETYRVFKYLMGITGDVSHGPDPRFFFRVVPSQRCNHTLKLRKQVADEMRYVRRVRRLEAEGMTTSDAQAVADAEAL